VAKKRQSCLIPETIICFDKIPRSTLYPLPRRSERCSLGAAGRMALINAGRTGCAAGLGAKERARRQG